MRRGSLISYILVAVLAALATGSSATAVSKLMVTSTSQIKDNTVTGGDIRDGTVSLNDLNPGVKETIISLAEQPQQASAAPEGDTTAKGVTIQRVTSSETMGGRGYGQSWRDVVATCPDGYLVTGGEASPTPDASGATPDGRGWTAGWSMGAGRPQFVGTVTAICVG